MIKTIVFIEISTPWGFPSLHILNCSEQLLVLACTFLKRTTLLRWYSSKRFLSTSPATGLLRSNEYFYASLISRRRCHSSTLRGPLWRPRVRHGASGQPRHGGVQRRPRALGDPPRMRCRSNRDSALPNTASSESARASSCWGVSDNLFRV